MDKEEIQGFGFIEPQDGYEHSDRFPVVTEVCSVSGCGVAIEARRDMLQVAVEEHMACSHGRIDL
jgi:hypothetical protein